MSHYCICWDSAQKRITTKKPVHMKTCQTFNNSGWNNYLPQGPWPGCWAHPQTAEVDKPSSCHSGTWNARNKDHPLMTLDAYLKLKDIFPVAYTLRYLWTSLGRYSLSNRKWSPTTLSVRRERQWEVGWSDMGPPPAVGFVSRCDFCGASSFWLCQPRRFGLKHNDTTFLCL